MSDATSGITASKPAATSTTIQGSVLQFIISATALAALLAPKHADQINGVAQTVESYLPMAFAVGATVIPLVMTIIGRFTATTPLH